MRKLFQRKATTRSRPEIQAEYQQLAGEYLNLKRNERYGVKRLAQIEHRFDQLEQEIGALPAEKTMPAPAVVPNADQTNKPE